MNDLTWGKRFETGIDRIDFQHQTLFTMIQSLKNVLKVEASIRNEVFKMNLDQLVDYTQFHFKTEEELMKRAKFPDFDVHIKLHHSLKNEVMNFYNRFNKGDSIESEVIIFLEKWLLNHIGHSDMEYVSYVKKMLAEKAS